MKNIKIILAATFGGASPTLLQAAMSLVGPQATLPHSTFWLGVVLFALLGGIAGWVAGETNITKAFFLGVSLPAFIQTSVANGQAAFAPKNPAGATATSSQHQFSLISSACAQETPMTPMISSNVVASSNAVAAAAVGEYTNRLLILTTEVNSEVNPKLRLYDVKGDLISQSSLYATSGAVKVKLPSNAVQAYVTGDNIATTPISLAPAGKAGSSQAVSVGFQRNDWSGFKRSLGFKQVSDFDVTVKSEK
jgi:hypothetical protein